MSPIRIRNFIVLFSLLLALILLFLCHYKDEIYIYRHRHDRKLTNDWIIDYLLKRDDNQNLYDDSSKVVVDSSISETYHQLTAVKGNIFAIAKRFRATGSEKDFEIVGISEVGDSIFFGTTVLNHNNKITTCEHKLRDYDMMFGFIGICDDHYFVLNEPEMGDYTNYAYCYVSRDIGYLSVIIDSKGKKFKELRGRCDSIEVKENLEYINKLFEKCSCN